MNMKSLSDLLKTKIKLEGEREGLVRRLEEVDREILSAQREIEEYRSNYNNDSPILSLPAEITSLIFLEAFSTFEFSEQVDKIQVHPTELTISHVCRQWRSVAIGLPFLWSSFYYHGQSATPATLDCFKVYLDRSKSNALELWLDLRRTTSGHQLCSAMLDQAIAVVCRWKIVSIFSNSTEIAAQLEFKNLHAPNLEHLTLHLNFDYPENQQLIPMSPEPQFIAEGAPKLTSAWLHVSAPIFCLPPIFTVTTLRIEVQREGGFPTLQFSLAALRAILTLPNLENLSVVEVSSHDESDGALILMGRLRHLHISGEEALSMYELLPTIRAPLLETLILQNIWIEAEEDPSTMYSFPSLTSLSLLDVTFDIDDSLRYLALRTGAARQITIVHAESNPSQGIISAIRDLPNQVVLWPQLENLICDLGRYNLGCLGMLFKFLKHRKSTGDLTLRISDVWMEGVKGWFFEDPEFAGVLATCVVEDIPEKELRNVGPWPPGGNGLLNRRIDLEGDSFLNPFIAAYSQVL
jgi:hypothetical protein